MSIDKRLLRLAAPLFLLSLAPAVTLTTVWVLWPQPARAANFVVNSTADAVDANPGDGVCDDGAGNCTLRAATQETDALLGPDTIVLSSGAYVSTSIGADEDAAAPW